jgi:ribosomal 50S subunit-associated protein YjgA (DUF615 family)
VEDEDNWVSRSERRRTERLGMAERKEVLETYIRLPEYRLKGLEYSPEVQRDLALARRLKPSGARARVVKNLGRRMGDEDWEILSDVVNTTVGETGIQTAHDEFVVGLRDSLVSGGEAELQDLRSEHPDADHRSIRQLLLQARRKPESGTAKSARKKLMKIVRALYPNSE